MSIGLENGCGKLGVAVSEVACEGKANEENRGDGGGEIQDYMGRVVF